MTLAFQNIAIIGRYQTPGLATTLVQIAQWLRARGARVLFEGEGAKAIGLPAEQALSVDDIGKQADLAVVVGGDGTMLGIARALAPFDVPLLGINSGRLGFITDVPLSLWQETLSAILDGAYEIEQRTLLNATVLRGATPVFSAQALNDIVISRGASGRMVDVQVDVDGVYMYSQRADGLIVSTPTGSTAYALSANGPILYPSLNGLVIVPVAPQSLSNRPIVLPDSSRITIRVRDADEARVHCDMQEFAALQEDDVIEACVAKNRIRFVHPVGHSHFATLRQKLHWHAMPSGIEKPTSGLI